MKLKNVKKEVYKPTTIDGIESDRVITNDDGTVKQLHGSVFKDVTVEKNKKDIIGKYVMAFAKNGLKAILVKGFYTENNDETKMRYVVIDGANEPKFLRASIEAKMPFFAYDRVEDILRNENFTKEENSFLDKDFGEKPDVSRKDKRVFYRFGLMDGFSSFGKVYTDFTMDDRITFKYAVTDVNGVKAVIRIIKKNKRRNEITFEVMRSPLAYNKAGKTSGFGTYTANVEKGKFQVYDFFRDAVHDYNFLQKAIDNQNAI